jgi:hypothetical protein
MDNSDPTPPRDPAVPSERDRLGLLPLTLAQRRAVLAIGAGLCAVLLALLVADSMTITDPQPDRGARADELLAGVDPNTADADTLSALPTLGPGRARAIIAARQTLGRRYEKPEDLLAVPGIGVGTLEQIRPFLHFATTQPALEGVR